MRTLIRMIRLASQHHFWGSLAALLFTIVVIAAQVTDRNGFANSALHRDVMDRWGTPIVQPVPSVRFVESGTIFSTLEPLALASQRVDVDVTMNYRKRGLVYFSGFDFSFDGIYAITNPEPHAIEAVFVFPLDIERNRVLMSDLAFNVDGRAERIDLDGARNKLVWTGRLGSGESRRFEISFSGRGLESFTYLLDPDSPVRDLRFVINVAGGAEHDYAEGVVPATRVTRPGDDGVVLEWTYASLESGVPLGVIVPSEESFDGVIHVMLRRAWPTFTLWFISVAVFAAVLRRPLRLDEAYVLSATFSFFYVLLPYLAAYVHFYVAYAMGISVIGGMLIAYQSAIFGRRAVGSAAGGGAAFLLAPTLAVVVRGHTGLIYTLLIAAGLVIAMRLTTEAWFSRLFGGPAMPLATPSVGGVEEGSHV